MGLVYVGKHTRHRKARILLRYLLLTATVVLVAWGFVEPKLLQMEYSELISSALSSDVGQLRVVFLSDIHLGNWPYLSESDVAGLVTKVNEQKPDLVLLGGDYASDPDRAVDFFRDVPSFQATYGVYAVLGECDRGTEAQLNELEAVLRQRNITPLINEVRRVRIGLSDIVLAGVDDITNGSPDLASVASQCSSDDLVIFLCHHPQILSSALNVNGADGKRNWFDIGLFGHTHGGQISTYGGVLGVPSAGTSYRSGWYTPNKLNILVSDGVGTSGIPMRLGHTPKVYVITIKSV